MLFRMGFHGGILFTRFLFFVSEWVIISTGISILRALKHTRRYSSNIHLIPNTPAATPEELTSS
jgi:hypothetical protein